MLVSSQGSEIRMGKGNKESVAVRPRVCVCVQNKEKQKDLGI